MVETKDWYKSKTLWVGFGIGLLGLVQATVEQIAFSPSTQGLIVAGIGGAMMFLRGMTSTPVKIKK